MMRFYKEDYYMKKKQLIKVLSVLFAVTIPAGMFCVTANAAEYDPDTFVAGEAPVQGDDNDLPSSYSSVEQGYVTDIKNQRYNDCWAYSTLAALESKLLKEGYQTENMNESHLNLWAMTRSDGNGWVRSYTGAGLVYTGSGYLTSWQGGVLISDIGDYPLSSSVKGDEVPTDMARYGVTGIRYLAKEDPETVKRVLYQNGGAAIAFAYNSTFLSSDGRSYYMPPTYNGSYVGHQVELIGWDDNYPAQNFSDQNGNCSDSDGAWLIKNSWGTGSGDQGFLWISYNDKNVLHSRFAPNYSIESVLELDDTVSLLQNEIYGATYEFVYIKENDLTFINRFALDGKYDVLDKVVFETECAGADYTLYLVPDDNGAPTSDTARWTKLSEGTVPYEGYICDDFADVALSGDSISVAVRIDASSISKNASVGVGEWLTSNSNYVFYNESERGQSYLYRNGAVTDVMDYYEQELSDTMGGTLVIKGVVRKSGKPLYGDVNLDGRVDVTDATAVQRYSAGLDGLTAEQLTAADVDGDGAVNVTDATQIQKFAAGLITRFPVEDQ